MINEHEKRGAQGQVHGIVCRARWALEIVVGDRVPTTGFKTIKCWQMLHQNQAVRSETCLIVRA
jgi:hypothetical protein